MATILRGLGGLVVLGGLMLLFRADDKTTQHQTTALLVMLIGVVALGLGEVVNAIQCSADRIVEQLGRVESAHDSPVAATGDGNAEDASALLRRAEELHYSKQFSEAIAMYESVVARFPDSKSAASARRQIENLRR